MKMKFMMAFFVALITMSVSAQNNSQREKKEFPAKEMIAQLSLTNAQVTALKEVETQFESAMQELRKNRDNQTKMEASMKKARTERLETIKTHLNTEQYIGFLEYESINSMSGTMRGGQRQNSNQDQQRPRNSNFGGGDFGGDF